jgi:hypothetical protein
MIPPFEKLSHPEQECLIKAPVLLSVLASCSTHGINQTQKADAIKLAHIKTFTALPQLLPYYREVEKNFKFHFDAVAKEYYPFNDTRRNDLKMEIRKVQEIIKKLEPGYAKALNSSLERYAGHVKRATHSIFRDFIFPLAMPDLRDNLSANL